MKVFVFVLLKIMVFNKVNGYNETDDAGGHNVASKSKMLVSICSDDILKLFNISLEVKSSKEIYVENLSGGWSENFMNCTLERRVFQLNASDFCAIDNATIYITEYSIVYSATDYYIHGDRMIFCIDTHMNQSLIEKDYVAEKTKVLASICSESILKKFSIILEKNSSKHIYVESLTTGWSEEFLNCAHIKLDTNEFCAIDNSTIYVAEYSIAYNATDYYPDDDGVHVCATHEIVEQMNKSSKPENRNFEIITTVGISLSNICLGLHMLTFICLPETRNLSGKNLFSLTIAVFFGFIFFVISSNVRFRAACILVSLLTYYFLISSFLWMSIIGFEIWRSLKMLRYETGFYAKNKEFQRYLQYSIFGWITPILLVVIILIIDHCPGVKKGYSPDLGKDKCWFNNLTPFLVFFLTPLVLVMVSNLLFFIWSSYIICHTDQMSRDKRFKVLMKRCVSYFRLFIVTGLTWITGIIYFSVPNTATAWIFVIFTSFYGMFIFISFTLTNKVLRKLRSKFPFMGKWLPVTVTSVTSDTQESKT